MYKNWNNDRGEKRRDVGFSCLSWRAQNQGGRPPNHPADSSQPKSLLDLDKGMPLDNRQQMERAGNGIHPEASHPKPLMGGNNPLLDPVRLKALLASIDKKIGPQGDSHQPNAADESRLSWRSTQSGAPNISPVAPPRSLLDEPTHNLNESRLSWRAAQSDGPARNFNESRLDESPYKLDEPPLSWRAAQSGPPNNSSTETRPRSLLDGPARNIDESLLGRQPVGHDESRLSWRASQSGPPNNSFTEPHPPRSLLDEPRNFDESRLGGCGPPQVGHKVDEPRLSWRTSQSGPPNNSSTEPYPRSLLDEPRNFDESRLGGRGPPQGGPAQNHDESRLGWPGPQSVESARNLDESRLSWRALQSGPRNNSSMESHPQSLLDEPRRNCNDSRQDWHGAPPDERPRNIDDSQLSWRARQSGEQHGNHPDSRLTFHPSNSDGQCRTPTEPHSRPIQGAPDIRPSESRPRSLLGGGNRIPESHPKPLLECDNREGRQLSWRSSQSSHMEDGRMGNLWNRENHDSNYRDMDNKERLSWRSTNSGANNTNLPQPLLPNERPGGSLLGKTKYSDMYPGEKLGMQRDSFGDRFRPAGYAANSYY